MFGFPKVPRPENFQYKNNFLRTFTFQISFDPISFDKEIVDIITAKLKNSYQNFEPLIKGEIQIIEGNAITSEKPAIGGLKVNTKDQGVGLQIQDNSFWYLIQGNSYSNFNAFFKEKKEEMDFIAQTLKIANIKRVGIRKVNILNFNLVQEGYTYVDVLPMIFNTQLVQNFMIFPSQGVINKGLNNISLNDKESLSRLNLIYGFVTNENTKAANGVLDIDMSTVRDMKMEDVFGTAKTINEEIFNVFQWCLQKEMINKLDR